ALLLAASLLPIANWIPGGEFDAAYAARIADWGLGFALCAGIGVLAWFLARGRAAVAIVHGSGVTADASSLSPVHERRAAIAIAVLAFAVYALIATQVFSGRPLLIDEIVQVLQARDLATGRLTHE